MLEGVELVVEAVEAAAVVLTRLWTRWISVKIRRRLGLGGGVEGWSGVAGGGRC